MKQLFNFQVKAFLLFSLVASFVLPDVVIAAPVTGPVSLATAPLTSATTTLVKPNLLFVLDNSGSMDWDHMPDDEEDNGSAVTWDFGYYGMRSSQCNQTYYDPSITYLPPVNADGTSYVNASFTAAYGGLQGGYASSPTSVNLNTNFQANQSGIGGNAGGTDANGGAYYYAYSGTQDTQLEKNYNSTTNTFYNECRSALGAAPGNAVFAKRKLATTETTTIVVGGSSGSNVSINDIKVNGIQIMSGASTGSTSTNAVATNVATKITLSGFTATALGSTITITGPTSAANHTPVITESTGMTFTTDVFPDTTAANLTNFANWYSYYRTRMLMMKTSAGHAFSSLNNKYRVGLMKISATGAPAVPAGVFEGAQRASWYSTLYGTATSGSTPLRRALSEAGRYFAGKIGTDPVQYSCQQNFSILSTDGYWNTGDGYKENGSTPVGNQDGTAVRPMYDGYQATTTVTTQYTRNTYSTSSSGCSGGKKKLRTQPEKSSCSVTLGVETCGGWSNNGSSTSGSCVNTVTLPVPNPSAKVASGTPVTTAGGVGGTSDNLADIAMYYYANDLRPGTCTLCTDNVFKSNLDSNRKQHMTTFTLGLGASGWMNYSPDYLSDGAADFEAVELASTASTSVCTWQASGTVCNWPVPGMSGSEGFIANIDDLWHAAVNGRGAYFSATNPETLSYGLSNALAAIDNRKGSSAAAATSTLTPVDGNNFSYYASYTTGSWKGNLEARQINTITGKSTENATWCVEDVAEGICAVGSTIVEEITAGDTTIYNCVTPGSTICNGGVLEGTNCKVPIAIACNGTLSAKVADITDTRKIWTKGPGASTLNNFDLVSGALNTTDFDATKLAGLTQWPSLVPSTKQDAAVTNIVNYLRGQKGYEDTPANDDANRLFRARDAVLGDAIESTPAFAGKPDFSYVDSGYSAYQSTNASRSGTVYIGTNDGMLHAFNSATGEERWAYVPSMVIPNMWKLADSNYAANHSYYVNGSPEIADVLIGGTWETILVAGLNGGGRGYYALKITNPDAPELLWEFTPNSTGGENLGYSFGKPVITKKTDGTWVVLVTSGYNNIPEPTKTPLISTGDGKGYLYVLNPADGAIIGSPISTGEGNVSVPSGLAQVRNWVDDLQKNNTTTFTYGGDLLGNVWRFNIKDGTVTKFAELKAGSTAQPVMTSPEFGNVLTTDGKVRRVVVIATGKYLETDDLTDTSQQTIYAIKDDDTLATSPATATFVNPRGSTGAGPNHMVEQTLTASGDERIVTSEAVNFINDRGWFVDLPESGERVNLGPQLDRGTLTVPSLVPSNTVCEPGGHGWDNYFSFKTGGAVDSATGLASTRTESPIVGFNIFYLPDPVTGKLIPYKGSVHADGTQTGGPLPTGEVSLGFQKKRAIWRELITD